MTAVRIPLPREGAAHATIRSPDKPLQGRYRMQFLTRGGTSCAYRVLCGQQTYFAKEVALEEAEAAAQLRAETRTLRRLPMGNFPRFVDSFEEDGHLYLVTEFLSGTTLEQEVQRNPWNYPESEELSALALALCQQLEILHNLKPPLLYLDLKPGNTIRSPQGKLYLIDFGLSRTFQPPFTPFKLYGSPQTASPEHYTGKLDFRSDLFSLAATVHYVATRGQAERAEHGPFPSAKEQHADVSQSLDAWLQKCLNLNPDLRYPSVLAARRALQGEGEPGPSEKKVPAWRRWFKGK